MASCAIPPNRLGGVTSTPRLRPSHSDLPSLVPRPSLVVPMPSRTTAVAPMSALPLLRPSSCPIFPSSALQVGRPSPRSITCSAAAAAASTASAVGTTPLAASISKIAATALGYLVLVGACFRSMPQIARIWKEQSVEGLSVTAFMTELICFTVTIAYNVQQAYPFSTYGDVVMCWLQDIVIMGLMVHFYKPNIAILSASVLAFSAYSAFLIGGGCSMDVLQLMQTSTIFVFAFGNSLSQIVLNWKRGNSGVLSLTTCALNVAGNAVRMFTTLVLTKDMIILFGFGLQFLLNSVLLHQCLMTAKGAAGEATAK